MSDDEDEPLIDDSLLVTNVTAESLGLAIPQGTGGSDPVQGTSKAAVVQTTDRAGATILTFPASMELTLQYLSGELGVILIHIFISEIFLYLFYSRNWVKK